MYRMILMILLLGMIKRASAQSLLLNGGFEDINVCTEYNVECAPEAWMSSSSGFLNYFKDSRRAHSGENSMAVEAAHFQKRYNRTYLRTQLVCGLRKNHQYRISFFIKSIHPLTDSMGIWFTHADPLYGKTFMQGKTPSLYLKGSVGNAAFGDSSWRKVSLTYTATGEEVFFLIGYFGRNDYRGERLDQMENRYYVFLDDFSMTPLDPDENLCRNWLQMKEDIYLENERHELLARKIKYYQSRPPAPPVLEKNSVVVIDTLVLPDILFETGKADLQSSSYSFLDRIAARARAKQIDSLVIKGHTDNTGTVAGNEALSLARAKSAADYLAPRVSHMPIPVFVYGFADRVPVADNDSPEGRQKNRRVEILLYVRE